MTHLSSQFIKELPSDNMSDLSDVSDINPQDLAKVLKSASELDDEIFGFPVNIGGKDTTSSNSAVQNVKTQSKSSATLTKPSKNPSFDDPLADLSFSDDEKIFPGPKTTASAPLIGSRKPHSPQKKDETVKAASANKITELFQLEKEPLSAEDGKTKVVEKRRQGDRSADWLGLKDSPEQKSKQAGIVFDKSLAGTSDKKGIEASEGIRDLDRKLEKAPAPRLKFDEEPKTKPILSTAKSNILAELFGDEEEKSVKPTVSRKDSPEPVKVDSVGGLGYQPSLGLSRRTGRRSNLKETSPMQPLDIGNDADTLWPPPQKQKSNQTVSHVKKVSQEDIDLPLWLGGGRRKSQQEEPTFFDSKNLDKDKGIEKQYSEESTKQSRPLAENQEDNAAVIPPDLAGQLAVVQSRLDAAMTKRHENLQSYMKELITEAERISTPDISYPLPEHLKKASSLDKSEGDEKIEVDPVLERQESNKIDEEKENEIKEDALHRLRLTLQRLEMENLQLEMKIENIHSLHETQIENCNKAHEYEIKVWEARVERLKNLCTDLEEDYAAKLRNLKENEAEVVKCYKERIESLQEERLRDLKQLGDFHRMALEQAASLAVFIPQGRPGSFRLPLKLSSKREDGEELTEKEKSIIEKERELELIRAELNGLREEIEEERESQRRSAEERDRDLRRALAEVKFKGELAERELEREKAHIIHIKEEAERLKESAIKEQSELVTEKLNLAAEKARLDAAAKLHGGNISSIDVIKAQTEVEAALDAAREAREEAEGERRRNREERRDLEAIAWEQGARERMLDAREARIQEMMEEAEKKKEDGLKSMEEAKRKEKELEKDREELEENRKSLVRERMEVAKERLEMEKKRAELELVLPELTPGEILSVNPPRTYVDPKLLIMKLRAEKELNSYSVPKLKFT